MEFAIVPHDAPDGGLRYVISGKGQMHAMTDGLAGGYPGARNRYVWVHSGAGGNAPKIAWSLEELNGAKQDVSWGVFPLMQEDVLYVATNGGGGYRDPLERDPDMVLADVRDRVVSPQAARSIYGTVLADDGVDRAATAALRRDLVDRRRAAADSPSAAANRRGGKPISPTLVVCGDSICCASCGHDLAPASQSWKQASIVGEMSTEDLAYEIKTGEPAQTIVRLFACGGCGALLDTETALPGEPFLEDIVVT